MSFDSDLDISLVDGEFPDFASLKDKIVSQLNEDGIHPIVFDDLSSAFAQGRGHFRLHPAYLLNLLDKISQLMPDVSFDARGLGEEFRYTWIAEYREGRRAFTQGPWDYEF